jgi:Tol biopolymer transport system component
MILSSYSQAEVRIRQITPPTCGNNAAPSIDAIGNRIVFMSNCNLTGENSNGDFQIFLWQEDRRPNPFLQITRGSGVSLAPSISADGKRMAFVSDLDLTGENPGRVFQIFLWIEDRTPNAFVQITPRTTLGFSAQPRISADGGRIAFESTDDLAPGNPGNEDTNNEIFLWIEGRTPRPFVQITDTVEDNFFIFFPNFDGTRIGFHSRKPPRGRRPEFGHQEIFLWVDGESEIRQITRTQDQVDQERRCRALDKQGICFGNGDPSISWYGTKMSFASMFNLAGSDPENYEVYRWVEGSPFNRITRTQRGGQFSNDSSRINADGTRIALVSDRGRQTGCNRGEPGIKRLVLWVEGRPDLICITETTDPKGRSDNESIDALGTRIAFVSNARDLGNNPAGNDQIFLAEINLP